ARRTSARAPPPAAAGRGGPGTAPPGPPRSPRPPNSPPVAPAPTTRKRMAQILTRLKMLVDTAWPRNSTSLGKETFTETSLIASIPSPDPAGERGPSEHAAGRRVGRRRVHGSGDPGALAI